MSTHASAITGTIQLSPNYHKYDHAISSLPNEVLVEIFSHYVTGPLDVPHTVHRPLHITSICSDWRRVAISAPQLWCRLYIEITTQRSQDDYHLVNTWLGRSGARPLQYFVFWSEFSPYGYQHPALTALATHSEQWENMLLYLPLSAFHNLSGITGTLSHLRELSLGTQDVLGISRSLNQPLTAFREAPSLRRFECTHLPLHLLELPWAQLEEIPLLSVPVDRCIHVLRQCANLSSVVFALDYRTSSDGRPLVHTQLKSLTLSSLPGCELVNPKLFLRSLRAPNLIHLKISNLRTDFGAALQDFVQNTPLLTSISLSKLDVTDVELIQILESLPNLQRMILGPSAHMISDLVIQRLKFRSEQELEMKQFPPNVCPKLQTLSMHLPTDLAPTLAAVLSSRSKLTQGCAKLLAAKLHLRLWQKSLGDHQGWFEELRADGVVVDVDFHEDRPEDD